MDITIKKQQDYIIEQLKFQKEKIEPFFSSSFKEFVWFQPQSGRFLFDDGYIRYEIIEPLILNGTLIFMNYTNHQGELMLQYGLK
jgi:hypothetical protein